MFGEKEKTSEHFFSSYFSTKKKGNMKRGYAFKSQIPTLYWSVRMSMMVIDRL